MSYLKPVSSHTREFVDAETGETLGSETKKFEVVVKDQKEFCFIYSRMAMAFTNLDFAEAKVLVWSSLHTQLNTNEICLPKLIKQRLATEMQLNERTVDNAIQKLVKKGYFHRLGSGVYHIDPDLCWRGHESTHRRNLEVFITHKKPKQNESLSNSDEFE